MEGRESGAQIWRWVIFRFVWHAGRAYELMVYDMRYACSAALYSCEQRKEN